MSMTKILSLTLVFLPLRLPRMVHLLKYDTYDTLKIQIIPLRQNALRIYIDSWKMHCINLF